MPFLKSVIIWLILMLAETLHGVLRAFVLTPAIGDLRARQVAVVTGSAIIFLIVLAFAGWLGTNNSVRLLGVGVLWVFLTVAFEIALGRLIFNFSWTEIMADYNLFAGRLMLLGLAFMLICPLLAARIRDYLRNGKIINRT